MLNAELRSTNSTLTVPLSSVHVGESPMEQEGYGIVSGSVQPVCWYDECFNQSLKTFRHHRCEDCSPEVVGTAGVWFLWDRNYDRLFKAGGDHTLFEGKVKNVCKQRCQLVSINGHVH